MVKKCARHNIGLRRIAIEDNGFLLQLLFTIVVILGGIFLQISILQWALVVLLSTAFLITGFYRNAAHLVAIHDDSITSHQAIRIKAISNIMMSLSAGFTFFSFLMIFMPKINQLI